jgi:hypothetical protein
VSHLSGGIQSLELGLNSSVEQLPFDSGYITTSHGGLVDSVKDTRNRREEVWLQDLSIFEETQWISSEITNPSTNSDGAKFADALEIFT